MWTRSTPVPTAPTWALQCPLFMLPTELEKGWDTRVVCLAVFVTLLQQCSQWYAGVCEFPTLFGLCGRPPRETKRPERSIGAQFNPSHVADLPFPASIIADEDNLLIGQLGNSRPTHQYKPAIKFFTPIIPLPVRHNWSTAPPGLQPMGCLLAESGPRVPVGVLRSYERWLRGNVGQALETWVPLNNAAHLRF